ncbi:MAG TPA: LTA synthase family protein [Cytophagaceae bacterium]
MIERLKFLVKYYFFWLIYFLSGKLSFIFYHHKPFSKIDLSTKVGILYHGLVLDNSATSYLCFIPFLLIALGILHNHNGYNKAIKVYTIVIICLLSILTISDLELFSAWGYRINGTILRYAKSPGELISSTLSSPLLLLFSLLFFYLFIFIYFYIKGIHAKNFARTDKRFAAVLVLLVSLLIVPLRGGFQQIPVNESAVYFSANNLANQAAVNVFWNFTHSLLEKSYEETNPYTYFEKDFAQKEFLKLYPHQSPGQKILKNSRPNVVFIIWESFTSKALDSVQNQVVTPGFHELKKEGVFFDNIYASGDRSEKGLVAIISGYPAQTVASIMVNPAKNAKLPAISTELKNNGYRTSFIYGGELEFANIKSYLSSKNFDALVSINDFKEEQLSSKWGAHDEYTFDYLLTHTKKGTSPSLSMLFTLSSHEPFDVPTSPILIGEGNEINFLNSHHYTDSCLFDFIKKAKKKDWWDNTLIIIVADHGHPLPGGDYFGHAPRDFKIPMLWLGGALTKSDTVVQGPGSQTDIAKTLLNQLNIDASKFIFSRDLLSPVKDPFAYYSFSDGIGFVKKGRSYVFDNIKKDTVSTKGKVLKKDFVEGKAYLQHSFQDYMNK